MRGRILATGSAPTPEIDVDQAYFELLRLRRLVREARKDRFLARIRRSPSADLLLGLAWQSVASDWTTAESGNRRASSRI
jgi:hypothetical protein